MGVNESCSLADVVGRAATRKKNKRAEDLPSLSCYLWNIMDLLHRKYSNLAHIGKFLLQTLDVGFLLNFAIMIGVENAGADGLNGFDSLVYGHCIWLVYG